MIGFVLGLVLGAGLLAVAVTAVALRVWQIGQQTGSPWL